MNDTLRIGALCCVFLLLFIVYPLQAHIRINEVLASNSSINTDPDNQANADWVELYNSDSVAVNLIGCYLTDNFNDPFKYKITTNLLLPANGHVLLWCDDTGIGAHTNFKLSADGEEIALFNAEGVLLDSLTFGPQSLDISFARYPDGSPFWKYYPKPTPAAANDSTGFGGQVLSLPDFKLKGGIYTSAVTVEAYNDMGGTLRYTLDGSEPNENSPLYSGAISIQKTTCLRARLFKDKEIPGPVATETYFINEGFENRKLPVVSIATDPKNFWDKSVGIYAQSFKPEWEIPVNVELFDNNGSDRASFNEKAGIKVNGLYSWQLPQKMLGVYFRKQYGVNKLEYPLFHDRPRASFDNFALRASGSDWSYTMFRDGLVQQACHDFNMNLDNMAFRPSVVYVNGQYMGIHNIREKVDEDYVASNFGYKEGTFDLIENGDYVESGSLDAWNTYWALVNKDLSIQANFDTVANYMDIKSFSDLIVTEVFAGNSSIDHNTMAWKPKGSGKWRWILMDLDRGFFEYDKYLLSYYSGQSVWPLSQLLKNANYKTYLGTHLANHLYTTFNPIRMDQRIDRHKELIEAEMPMHIGRWQGTTSTYGNAIPSMAYWNTKVQNLKSYADGRPINILYDLQSTYGFSAPAALTLSVSPSEGGEVLFNDFKLSATEWFGMYPKNLNFTLKAVQNPGYNFKGWRMAKLDTLIAKKSSWYYLSNGSDQGTAWTETGFDATSWKTGLGILGYGFDTLGTRLTYGSNSTNKYITYYFRKSFNVSKQALDKGSFRINLLREDGALVYINGKQILQSNMPAGTVNSKTVATSTIEGTAESVYIPFVIPNSCLVEGSNVIAVEVHQVSASSSDMAFDLDLLAEIVDTTAFLSTSPTLTTALIGDIKLTAVYETNGQSIVPTSITKNTTLYKTKSPYYVSGEVTVAENTTLTIEPGVVVLMAPKSNFLVHGSIQALGTTSDSILFKLNPVYSDSSSWGALCFINTTDTTRMKHVTLQDASNGPSEFRCVSAISGWHTDLILDHLTLTQNDGNPIATRYSSVVLTNSTIHSRVLGDGINVKYGKARVENCVFEGNPNTDTDAIDYDGVENGIIRNVRIHGFPGFNSDAIDIGEEARNIQIDSLFIYDITDKGISVGQRSSVYVSHATILNTNLGFGVKDSSFLSIRNSTLFGIGTPVASYEKVGGRKGGNVLVSNSILSNSYDQSFEVDSYSSLGFQNCLSDNDSLPPHSNNSFGNPGFNAPGFFDFIRQDKFPAALGSNYYPITPDAQLTISDIFYNGNKATDRTEFIGLLNPGKQTIDLSGYYLSKAVEFTFPTGVTLEPGKKIFVVNGLTEVPFWINANNAFTWTSGNLANEGETIRVSDASGIVQDQVRYETNAAWPSVVGPDEQVLSLIAPDMDNHFASSWKTVGYQSIVTNLNLQQKTAFTVSPNPTRGPAILQFASNQSQTLSLYSLTGQKVGSKMIENGQSLDLSEFAGQMLLARLGNEVVKIVVLK